MSLAQAVIDAVAVHNYPAARLSVLIAAREGRAQYLPAGARDNATARVLIDGTEVGQASVLMHYVREQSNGTMYGIRPIIEGYAHQLPSVGR
jgi:hypothetical protein